MRIFAVGGSVRDTLLGLDPSDHDYVVVGATEQEMLDLGYKNVGVAFPVFLHPETGDEYALARKERKTGSGYLGFSVEFDPSVTIEEDLFRRDLTINSIAMDLETGEIIDPFGGQADLFDRNLRHTSAAFSEDPLRVIRLARFAARYPDFRIDPTTQKMAHQLVMEPGEMNSLSDERFIAEMDKMFSTCSRPDIFFDWLWHFGVFSYVNFFSDLFGSVTMGSFERKFARNAMHVKCLPEKDRLAIFIGLATSFDAKQTSSAIPKRFKDLTESMLFLNSTVMDAEMIGLFINMNHAWHDMTMLDDVFMALTCIEDMGGLPSIDISVHMLRDMVTACSSVSAEKYMHLVGKEIGRAIAAERLAVIQKRLENTYEGF